jgi:hypothetical protein
LKRPIWSAKRLGHLAFWRTKHGECVEQLDLDVFISFTFLCFLPTSQAFLFYPLFSFWFPFLQSHFAS